MSSENILKKTKLLTYILEPYQYVFLIILCIFQMCQSDEDSDEMIVMSEDSEDGEASAQKGARLSVEHPIWKRPARCSQHTAILSSTVTH